MTTQIPLWKLSWYKNISAGGAQNEAIKACKDNEIVIHSQTQKNGRLWTNTTPENIITLLNTNHGIYEVIHRFPHKLYVDIDMVGEPNESFLDTVKSQMLELFPNIIMAISGSVTPEKTSYHIVGQNYTIKNEEERLSIKHLMTSFNKTNSAFDWRVYTKNRMMKCVGQSKDDGRVQERLNYMDDISAHLITCFVPAESLDYTFPDEVLTDVMVEHAKSSFDISSLPRLKLAVPTDIDIDNLTPLQMLQLAPIDTNSKHVYKHLWMRFAFNHLTKEEYFSWVKHGYTADGRLTKWNYHWENASKFPTISIDRAMTLLSYFYPNIKKDASYRKFKDTFNLSHAITYIDTITQTHFKQHEHTDNFLVKSPLIKWTTFLVGMGGGKTFQTVKYLKTVKKFIWIAPNKALAHNTYNRLLNDEKIPVTHYLTPSTKDKRSGTLIDTDSIIVVANSLHYLRHIDETGNVAYNTPDVIVIDEIETLLSKWSGTFMSHKADNWNVFLTLIRGAKQVILLDAFITNQTLNFMKMCGGSSVVFKRKVEPITRTINYVPSIPDMFARMRKDLTNGEKLFIFYPYKNASGKSNKFVSMETLHGYLSEGGHTGIFYNADCDDKVKVGLKDVNVSWSEANFVITNSMITCGVNYDNEHLKFDKEYLFIASFNSPRDMVQVSYRPRHLSSNQINVCYMGNMGQVNTFEDDCADINCPIYTAVIKGVLIEKMSPIKKTFQLFCNKANYRNNIDTSQMTKQLQTETIEMVQKYEIASRYSGIEDITWEEEERIKQSIFSDDATMYEKFCLQKYHFKHQFVEAPNDELEQAWNSQYLFFLNKLKQVLIKGDDGIFMKIRKELNVKDLIDIPKKVVLSTELINQIFKEFTFKYLKPSSSHMLILKEIYNTYFGVTVIKSHTDNEEVETADKKTSHNMKYSLNDDTKINEWFEFVGRYSRDKAMWCELPEWVEECDFH